MSIIYWAVYRLVPVAAEHSGPRGSRRKVSLATFLLVYLERARIFLLLRFKRRMRFLAHLARISRGRISMAVLIRVKSRVDSHPCPQMGTDGWTSSRQGTPRTGPTVHRANDPGRRPAICSCPRIQGARRRSKMLGAFRTSLSCFGSYLR